MEYINQTYRQVYRRFDQDGSPIGTHETISEPPWAFVHDRAVAFGRTYESDFVQNRLGQLLTHRFARETQPEDWVWVFERKTSQESGGGYILEGCGGTNEDYPFPPRPSLYFMDPVSTETTAMSQCFSQTGNGAGYQANFGLAANIPDLSTEYSFPAGRYRFSSNHLPDMTIDLREFQVRNLRVINQNINDESPDPLIKVRAEFNRVDARSPAVNPNNP